MIGYKVHVGTRLPHYYCRIVLMSVACCAALPFGTLSYKRHELGEDLLSIKCVFGFRVQFCVKYLISEKNLASCYNCLLSS